MKKWFDVLRTGYSDAQWQPRAEGATLPFVARLAAASVALGVLALLLAEAVDFDLDFPILDSPSVIEDVATWLGRRSGVAAALALAVASFTAIPASLLSAPLRGVFGLLTVTSAAAVVAWLPSTLAIGQTASSDPSMWVYAVVALPVAVLVGKQTLLRRAATRWHNSDRRIADDLASLLPTQFGDLQNVVTAICSAKRADREHVVQVSGRWGDGKSFLIQHLEPALAHYVQREDNPFAYSDSFAVVKVDVWKQESEAELHQAVVEEVLAHPASFYPWGWLRFPLSLLLPARLGSVTFRLFANLGAKADVQVPIHLPRLLYQRTLVDVVARARRRGFRTVVVLDEIDRATNLVAQTAITLMRRSFDLPGATVIAVYVDDAVDYKVFNPLVEQLPDLAASSEAILWSRLPRGDRPPPTPPQQQSREFVGDVLRAEFAQADDAVQHDLIRLMAEKFLSSSPVPVRPMSTQDVVALLSTPSLDLAETIDYLLDGVARSAVTTPFQIHIENEWQGTTAPPIRPLIGSLRRMLRAATEPGKPLHPNDIVWFLLVACVLAESGLTVREASNGRR